MLAQWDDAGQRGVCSIVFATETGHETSCGSQDQLTACLTQDSCESIVAEAKQISSEPHVEEDDGVLHDYLQEVQKLLGGWGFMC